AVHALAVDAGPVPAFAAHTRPVGAFATDAGGVLALAVDTVAVVADTAHAVVDIAGANHAGPAGGLGAQCVRLVRTCAHGLAGGALGVQRQAIGRTRDNAPPVLSGIP